MTTIDYNTYNASKLQYALKSTREQIAKFEKSMIAAQKQLKKSSEKRKEYEAKEALIRKALNLKLPMPNEETRKLLDNDEVDGRWNNHRDFIKSLENEE